MKVAVNDTASAMLAAISARIGDMKPLMTMMGNHMETSVRRNFDQGGRPDPWRPLKNEWVVLYGRARKNQRKQGRARSGGPLVLTGDLRSSIGFTPESTDLVLWARPNENPIKAAVHQFGTKIAGKKHNVTIPARPYLLFQQTDLEWFRKALSGWVRVGSRGVAA